MVSKIHTLFRQPGIWLLILSSILISSCIKEIEDTGYNPNGDKPFLITSNILNTNQNSGLGGGTIINEGKYNVIARGVCWDVNPMPTLHDEYTEDSCGPGIFTSLITGLTPNTFYYVRAYATDSSGTYYGNTITFRTKEDENGIVYDIDGNSYHTVSIGKQVWLMENLKVTHFRNGDIIPNIIQNTNWTALNLPAWSSFLNDSVIAQRYGKLYNWYVVNDTRGIAPQGWHLATEAEWQELFNFLGGSNIAGGKLKEAGLTNWAFPNTGASNEYGFTAKPAGLRFNSGVYSELYYGTYFWIASNIPEYYSLSSQSTSVEHASCDKKFGLSLRCIKD
jgi:uncharacterized protein (TIGR02145 family)